jgi:hypothetical protein
MSRSTGISAFVSDLGDALHLLAGAGPPRGNPAATSQSRVTTTASGARLHVTTFHRPLRPGVEERVRWQEGPGRGGVRAFRIDHDEQSVALYAGGRRLLLHVEAGEWVSRRGAVPTPAQAELLARVPERLAEAQISLPGWWPRGEPGRESPPLRAPLQQQIDLVRVALGRARYMQAVKRIPARYQEALGRGGVAAEHVAHAAVVQRRTIEARARIDQPRWANEIAASRNIRTYGDPLGPKGLSELPKKIDPATGVARPRTPAEAIWGAGKTSRAFGVASAVAGTIGGTTALLEILGMATDLERRGFVDVGPVRVAPSSGRLSDGTRARDFFGGTNGTVIDGRFVPDPT